MVNKHYHSIHFKAADRTFTPLIPEVRNNMGLCWPLWIFFSLLILSTHASAQPKDQANVNGQGIIIRSITVEIRDIFDEPDLGFAYKSINRLKASTVREVVEREMLLEPGAVYNEFLREESERNLRALSFLREVSVVPVFDGDFVDIVVSVQDAWTLFPQIGFSSGGGTKKTQLGLAEVNLLGYGKRLELFYADDDGREKVESVYKDNRFLGSKENLLLGVFERSDGYRSFIDYGRPFRSLGDSSSWSVNADVYDLVGGLFKNGNERFIYRVKHEEAGAGYALSVAEQENVARRLTFGYKHKLDDFTQADIDDYNDVNVDPNDVDQDPDLLADDRRFSGPLVSYQRLESDFISLRYIDKFQRVEDYNLGNDLRLETWIAPTVLDSSANTLIVSMSDSDGYRLGEESFFRHGTELSSRLDEVGFANTTLGTDFKLLHSFGPIFISDVYLGRHTFASSLEMDLSSGLDRDKEFVLGATNGLRGYEDMTFAGTSRLLLNLEERFYVVDDLFRILSLGGAAFVDLGGTSTKAFGNIFTDDFYGDVGFGLRFGFPRSSGGSVMRMDLAFPIRNGPDGSMQWEPRLFISTGAAFTSRLRNERTGEQSASTSLVFVP